MYAELTPVLQGMEISLAGDLQGDTLAPYLFAIVLDYAMRQAISGREEELGFKLDRRSSRRHHPIILTDTDFADEIAITTEEIAQAQEMLNCLEIEGFSSFFLFFPLVIILDVNVVIFTSLTEKKIT